MHIFWAWMQERSLEKSLRDWRSIGIYHISQKSEMKSKEKLGCGHYHAETHQSPIETSSISPSYTPQLAEMENSAPKMDDFAWESWLEASCNLKAIMRNVFFNSLRKHQLMLSQVWIRSCPHFCVDLSYDLNGGELTAPSPPRHIPDSWWCKAKKGMFKRSKIPDNILSNYL